MDNVIKWLGDLSRLPGVSGDEGAVRDYLIRELEGCCPCEVDSLGNLIVEKKGEALSKNRLLLSAHMDEVGFIVTHIEDSGLLRFAAVGGIDSRVIPGKAVKVGRDGLYGVIGTKAMHQQTPKERGEAVQPDSLYIDIGAKSRDDAEKLVSPGDRAVFHADFQTLGGGNILGKALDDRAGCALLLALAKSPLPCDCTLAFTVQEETGCVGAKAVGYRVDPDIALVVETTTASDIAGVEPDKVVCRLGGGPVLSFMDRGAIYHRELYRLAMETAGQNNIPCQAKEGIYGGNEARSIQTSRSGAKTLAVSLPCRYLHTASNMLRVEDIQNTLELLRLLTAAFGEV